MLSSLTRRPLTIIVIVVSATAIFTELVLRVLGFGNPLLYRASASGYEVVPNQAVTRFFKQTKYNSLGLRNDPIAPEPSRGVKRLICLGDSITYGGSDVDNSGTYTGQLQALLPGVEVLNASAPGWALSNELRWLVDHGLFSSSILVLELGEVDLFEPFVDSSILDQIPSFPSRHPISAIGEIMTRYALPNLGLGPAAVDPGAEGSELDLAAAEENFEAVKKIHEYTISHGARLMILYMDPAEPSDDFRIVAARDRLFEWAQHASVRLVRPNLDKRQSDEHRLFHDYAHPNQRGNRIIAEELARALSLGE